MKQICLRFIDRFHIGLLAVLVAASGLYLVGPWYLETQSTGDPSPLFYLTNNIIIIRCIGAGMLLAASGLMYSVTRKEGVIYATILSSSLLAAFLLRFYTLMGSVLTLESWRPPGYVSAAYSVAALGAYWVWVRKHERITR